MILNQNNLSLSVPHLIKPTSICFIFVRPYRILIIKNKQNVRARRRGSNIKSIFNPIQFYTDAVNAAVFGTPVAYLHKYDKIDDYTAIVQTEDTLLGLLYQIVGKRIDKSSKIS